MVKVNDLVVFNGYSLVCTEIKREGMPLFAVIKLTDNDDAVILHTFLSEQAALTMLSKVSLLIGKLKPIVEVQNEVDDEIEITLD